MFSDKTRENTKLSMDQRDKDRAAFLKSFLNLVLRYDHFVLFPHVNPDGDCLGCVFGFQELIRSNFPHKKAYVVGESFGMYPWLPMQFDNFLNYDFDFSNAAAFIFDVGQSARIQKFEKFFKNSQIKFGVVAKIDHHGSTPDFHIDLIWDDPTYAAASCQVVQIADFYGWKMTPKAATFLYLGICTDSLRFSSESVLPRALILAAKTWRAGADYANIHRRLGHRTWHSIKAANHLLENCHSSGNVIWYKLSKKEIHDLEIHNPKGMVSVFQDIEENWIWILFIESDNSEFNVDIRSIHVTVRDLAIKYGGGGHENASGARINESQIQSLVDDAEKIVADAKKKIAEAGFLNAEQSLELENEKKKIINQAPYVIEDARNFLRESELIKQKEKDLSEE